MSQEELIAEFNRIQAEQAERLIVVVELSHLAEGVVLGGGRGHFYPPRDSHALRRELHERIREFCPVITRSSQA